jgi:hypothetical protein
VLLGEEVLKEGRHQLVVGVHGGEVPLAPSRLSCVLEGARKPVQVRAPFRGHSTRGHSEEPVDGEKDGKGQIKRDGRGLPV